MRPAPSVWWTAGLSALNEMRRGLEIRNSGVAITCMQQQKQSQSSSPETGGWPPWSVVTMTLL